MKKIVYALTLLFLGSTYSVQAQDFSFSVELSSDTVLVGNYIELSYKLENAKGKIVPPNFKGFAIISGPNISSSISIINGDMSSSESYSYYLEPEDVGVYEIDPAYVEIEGESYESRPLEIIVLPNPDGIKTTPNNKSYKDSFSFGKSKADKKPKKKKRKLKKI